MTMVIILTLAGIPGLRDFSMNQNMKSALAMLQSDLKFARSEAVKLNSWTVACPGSAVTGCAAHARWNTGWMVFVDVNGDLDWQTGEPLLRQANALEKLNALGQSSRQLIRFYPGGFAPGSNTSIVFCDKRGLSEGQKLVISNSGRIRLSALSDSDASRCSAI